MSPIDTKSLSMTLSIVIILYFPYARCGPKYVSITILYVISRRWPKDVRPFSPEEELENLLSSPST